MAGEIDLRTRIVAAALQHLYAPFAKLGMKHIHADLQAMRRRAFLRWHRWACKAIGST